jgi:undecaprenyl pyrophosphate phosphatase UppP
MSTVSFLFLLSFFATLTGLVVEAIKKIMKDKDNRSDNLIALVTALIIGFIGTLLYYYFNNVTFEMKHLVFAILMGFASGLVAMNGYDKVKAMIEQLGK